MRIFTTSTPEELESYRAVACDVAVELGHEVMLRDPALVGGLKPVAACTRQIAAADVLLAIVGWRRGAVPLPEAGGDGRHPWTWWETRAAFAQNKPVVALLSSEAWRPELSRAGGALSTRDRDDPRAIAVMRDFRGELARLATFFDGDEERFRELVRRQLSGSSQASSGVGKGSIHLRHWPPPKLPERPYPVLLPYTHPDLMAGRERELTELRRLLAKPVAITGLHAASGIGKSSFLTGALVPALRGERDAGATPVAFDRHPSEPGLAARLLGQLIEDEVRLVDGDPRAFVDGLAAVRHAAGRAPILVLDQFEDLLRRRSGAPDEAQRTMDSLGGLGSRATVGMLLAASVQRLPGLVGPPCRWLLAYRQEFHGDVCQWLRDALRDARAEVTQVLRPRAVVEATEDLPHDLTGADRFRTFVLPPLGTPAANTRDRVAAAARVFEDAITKPLELRVEGDKQKVYSWRFAEGAAERLARAFGEARVARPEAPLAPELQVVLAHLLEGARRTGKVEVPEDPSQMITQALEEHLRRSFDTAFPDGRQERIGRTRALLALRELADARGQRDRGRSAEALAQAIGPEGREVLEKLATARTRIVLLEQRHGEQIYVLSHDRMAEILVRLFDEGAFAGLGVDVELVGLRRFVALQSSLFAAGELKQATGVPGGHARKIERHAEALLWGEERQRWWAACQTRRRADRRRRILRGGIAAILVLAVALVAGIGAVRAADRRKLFEQVTNGNEETAFKALATLTDTEGNADVIAGVRKRKQPFDVLEHGLGGIDAGERGTSLLRVASLLLPLIDEASESTPEKPVDYLPIASTVWALDFFAIPDPDLREEAMSLRNRVLEPLRLRHPPPSPPALDDPAWADVPAGTFWMGSGPGDGRDDPDMENERPRHQVTVSTFRLMVHEVTNAELRRLIQHPYYAKAPDDEPAIAVTWYEAYTFAAWLGGRLPTEAEWEYAARAGCPSAYCTNDRSQATIDQVAWWMGNSIDPESGKPALKPIGKKEANPWGLFDVYGNASEWTANWYEDYSAEPRTDPPGPTSSKENSRTFRGGHVAFPQKHVIASSRGSAASETLSNQMGFRVAGSSTRKPW